MSLVRSDAVSPEPPLRGYPLRYTNMMEAFQLSYIRAVAASSGCIVSVPEIDDGIDLNVTHKADSHSYLRDQVARLEIQLKATSDYSGKQSEHVSITMRRDRYDYYRINNPIVHKIIVILSMPKDQQNWVSAQHQALLVRHCAYWVSIAGYPASSAEKPTVKASVNAIFDDVALCGIMERIGQGGKP